jgi:hypothetical protein
MAFEPDGGRENEQEEIVAKLRQVDVLTAQGRPVAEAIRSIGVTEVTYYRWRQVADVRTEPAARALFRTSAG